MATPRCMARMSENTMCTLETAAVCAPSCLLPRMIDRAAVLARHSADTNYLEYSWHASYLFIILCVYVVFAIRPRFIWGYLGAVLSLAGLFLIGGRGPMLFGLLAIPLMLLSTSLRRVGFAGHTKRLVFYVVGIALVGIGGYYAALASGGGSLFGQDLVTVQRLELSLSGESTFSMDAREEAQRAAVSFWQERPFSAGALASSVSNTGSSTRTTC
jgi:hypothetical protein